MAQRVRGVYGKPWSKLAGEVKLSDGLMERLGQMLVDSVVAEARRDFTKQGKKPTPSGDPQGIPDTEKFFKSFGFKIKGKSTIEITSTWPWIEALVEGRDPYPMDWLLRPRGASFKIPILQPDGKVIVRMAPITKGDVWIHPGVAKHNFINRGIKKGRVKMAEMVFKELKQMVVQGQVWK